MRLDLVDMQLFLHVVEAGSITAGAGRAHLALASASERIRGMEELLGMALLVRGRRGVRATPAGDTFAHHARLVFQQLEHMRSELGEYAEGLKGHVRLLCNTSALSEFLPGVLAGFMHRYPNIDVEIEERLSYDVVKAVRDGAADIGIVSDAVDLFGLTTFPFRPDRLVVVASREQAESLTRADDPIPFTRVVDADFIGLAGDSALYRYLSLQAAQVGRTLKVRVRLRSFDAVCRMVESGVGISIVPESAAKRSSETMDIARIGLSDGWALRKLTICVRNADALPRHAKELIEALLAKPT